MAWYDDAWNYVETGWNYITGSGADTLVGDISSAYSGSWLETAVAKTDNFLDSGTGQAIIGGAKSAFFSDKGQYTGIGNTMKGGRLSGSARTSSGTGSGAYTASAVDMGYTARVQDAIRAASNARTGSGSVYETMAALKSRPAQGPLIKLGGGSQVSVKPRAR